MNCLCCGKPLKEPFPDSAWHPACIRRFFGTSALPEIELTDEALTLLAERLRKRAIQCQGYRKNCLSIFQGKVPPG